ncbi:MAG TPA: 5,6-dimethylbenzimidazole synthase [Rhodobacteraceae bacterium]|jgi:5,6-dimethylbenzimidazole synthase|nr:5,6-dimethylbenzimidazole synthase [Paracoccaceae bacterium]
MPDFSDQFRQEFNQLLRWRRDVRSFRKDPIEGAILERCFATFNLAPSVGLSEPWRVVSITSKTARNNAVANFEAENTDALKGYSGEKAKLYSSLKLSGMNDAPVQLAVYCDDKTGKGQGLGASSMPETKRYSVVAAITQFWLTARAEGLGVGWVSILDPVRMSRDLNVPKDWALIAYLCVGWPEENKTVPTLEQAGWEKRSKTLERLER